MFYILIQRSIKMHSSCSLRIITCHFIITYFYCSTSNCNIMTTTAIAATRLLVSTTCPTTLWCLSCGIICCYLLGLDDTINCPCTIIIYCIAVNSCIYCNVAIGIEIITFCNAVIVSIYPLPT